MRKLKIVIFAPASQHIDSIVIQAQEIAATPGIETRIITNDCTRAAVLSILRQREHDIWYFVSHGSAEGIQLDDQILPAEELIAAARSNARAAFGDWLTGKRRLQCIVINTCDSAGIIDRLTDAAPISAIGTIGPVDESTAFSVGVQWAILIADGIGYHEATELARFPGMQYVYKAHPSAPANRPPALSPTSAAITGAAVTGALMSLFWTVYTKPPAPPLVLIGADLETDSQPCTGDLIRVQYTVRADRPASALITLSIIETSASAGTLAPESGEASVQKLITFAEPGEHENHIQFNLPALTGSQYGIVVSLAAIGYIGESTFAGAMIEPPPDCAPLPPDAQPLQKSSRDNMQ